MDGFRSTALRRLASVLVLSTATLLTPQVVSAMKPVQPIELRERDLREIESVLTREIQALVDRQERIPGQEESVTAKATIDVGRSLIVINLSKGYLPARNGGAYEDLQHQIGLAATELIMDSIEVKGALVLIDGHPIEHYIPDNIPTIPRGAASADCLEQKTPQLAGLLVKRCDAQGCREPDPWCRQSESN